MPLRQRLKGAIKDVLEEIQNRVDGVLVQRPSRMSCPPAILPALVCVRSTNSLRKLSGWSHPLRGPLLKREIIPSRSQSIIDNSRSSAWSSLPLHLFWSSQVPR